jgi:hypothetical protein
MGKIRGHNIPEIQRFSGRVGVFSGITLKNSQHFRLYLSPDGYFSSVELFEWMVCIGLQF